MYQRIKKNKITMVKVSSLQIIIHSCSHFKWFSICMLLRSPNSCSLSQWCHPTISPSVASSSCPQSFPTLGSFPMSQLFASGDQSFGASASASVLPDCFFQVTWMISNVPQSLNSNLSLCYSKANAFSTLIVMIHCFFPPSALSS